MELSWTNDAHPFSKAFDDVYYTDQDGLQESRYVFLEQNGLTEKFKTSDQFVIGELGFGTARNFLATWDLWTKNSKPGAWLHYLSCEKFLLSSEQIRKATDRWPELETIREIFLEKYSDLPKGFHRLRFERERISLTLLIGDAFEGLKNLNAKVDAWYFDGFNPLKNPEMWSEELFKVVAGLSKNQTSFATYTSAGFVRRGLNAAGFKTEKFVGYGKKREMLKGHIELPATSTALSPQSAVVVGGGISGIATAVALAKRGCRVKIFEKNKILEGASNNRGAIGLPVLSAIPNTLSRLSWAGFKFLKNEVGRKNSGILKLVENELTTEKWTRSLNAHQTPPTCARFVNANEASEIAGVDIASGALYFSEGGWMNLPEFYRTQLETYSNLISLHEGVEVSDERVPVEADMVVLSGAHEISKLSLGSKLPFRKVRGQLAYLRSNADLSKLKSTICFDGFVTPTLQNGTHLLGATYSNGDESLDVRENENADLLEKLKKAAPSIFKVRPEVQSSWVQWRTNVPGMDPVIGKLKDQIYIATAFSSRGSLYAGLAGEIIAAKAFGEPLPIESDLDSRISPLRL